MQPNLTHINRNFSKAAHTYNYHATFQYDMAYKIAEKIITPPKHILDIGAGTGILTQILKDKFPHSHFTAIDISKQMLDMLKAYMGDYNITYVHCSGYDVNQVIKIIQNHNIDLIVSNLCFQWFQNPLEIYNIYKQYTNICISLLTQDSFYQWYDAIKSVAPWYQIPITTINHNYNDGGYHIHYKSGFDFLKSQQKLGTLGHQSPYLSPKNIKQACQIFQEKHHNMISYFPSILSNFS